MCVFMLVQLNKCVVVCAFDLQRGHSGDGTSVYVPFMYGTFVSSELGKGTTGCSGKCCFGVMYCGMVFVNLLAVVVCADYGGVNVFHVCLNFGVVYGVGVCVNVCVVVCFLHQADNLQRRQVDKDNPYWRSARLKVVNHAI